MPLPTRYQAHPLPPVCTLGPKFDVLIPKFVPAILIRKIAKTLPTTLVFTNGWCPGGVRMSVWMGPMQKLGDAIRSSTAAAPREEPTSLEAARQEEKKATSMEEVSTTSLEAALQEEESTTSLEAALLEECTASLPPRLLPLWTLPPGILARLKAPAVRRSGPGSKAMRRQCSRRTMRQ